MRRLLMLISLLGFSLAPAIAQAETCREFTRIITIGGKPQEGIGTACLQPDGSWRIVSGEESPVFEAPPEERVVVVEKEVPVYIERPCSYWEFSLGDSGYWDGHRRRCGHHGRGRGRGHHRWH